MDLNYNWKFTLEEIEGPHLNSTNDESWDTINLPHDWSVGFPFNEEDGEGCTGYLLGGMGWYRKHFTTSEEMKENRVFIEFDGIYNRATLYCNGELVRFHPYGYSPCLIELTDYLKPVGEDNCFAVRVDRTRHADSRWYTGSGIYRKVKMHILPQVHIPVWGTYFTTPEVNKERATIQGKIELESACTSVKEATCHISVTSPSGDVVYHCIKPKLVYPKQKEQIDVNFMVQNPTLWGVFEGNLYTIQIQLFDGEQLTQTVETKIGLRSIRFDVNEGFFLNEQHTLIKGVCLHHDAGLLGAAVPLDAWKRRLEKLKECGCNAIRTAHNPASADFLQLCDEMGFLVQEEFFDEWDNPKDKRLNGTEQKVDYLTRGYCEFFGDYAKEDLQNVMKRDRNHPCIFQWSIGNEIEWTYPKYNIATGYFGANANGNYFWTKPPYTIEQIRENMKKIPKDHHEVGETAHKLAKWTKEMDQTRPVIANCILPSASYESGYTDALDIVGYSYRQVVYEYGHTNYPDKPIMGTENLGQWHEWKHVLEKPYIPGIFLWTGIDYMGEAGKDKWPIKGTGSGLLDLAGFEKPSYYMFKSLWSEKPSIHIATQTLEQSLYELDDKGELVEKVKGGWKQRLWLWHSVNEHWNYKKDELVVAELYSNCEQIDLYLNDTFISTAYLKDFEDHIYKWVLPFQAGVLKAVGKMGDVQCETLIETSQACSRIELVCDQPTAVAGTDTAIHVVAMLMDENGVPVQTEDEEIEFSITGDCDYFGIDNGDNCNVNAFKSQSISSYKGRALIILGGLKAGQITVVARTKHVCSDELKIQLK